MESSTCCLASGMESLCRRRVAKVRAGTHLHPFSKQTFFTNGRKFSVGLMYPPETPFEDYFYPSLEAGTCPPNFRVDTDRSGVGQARPNPLGWGILGHTPHEECALDLFLFGSLVALPSP